MNMWEGPSENTEREREKQQAADRAVECVESGMVVGLGAGSTAILAARRIGQLLREGRLRDIVGVPCSSAIEAEARAFGCAGTNRHEVQECKSPTAKGEPTTRAPSHARASGTGSVQR